MGQGLVGSGRFESEFEYTRAWVSDSGAFALDPVSLPLNAARQFRAEMLYPPLAVFEDARAAISGAVPKFLGPDQTDDVAALGKSALRTGRFIVKGSDDKTPFLGFNEFYH